MLVMRAALLAATLFVSRPVLAQMLIEDEEHLDTQRPEAWAMNRVAASTLVTAFGESPPLAPWQWQVSADLAHISRLSDSQRRVGFIGSKEEDLNRSPVFGRLRVALGLPHAFVAELGYTPPLEVRGTRAVDLFTLALGCRPYEREGFVVSTRIFGQRGQIRGDITCPEGVAGGDPASNPFECQAASDDRISVDYYGLDATATWDLQGWRTHATLGAVRTDLEVQVDALAGGVRDRSRLYARSSWPFATLGVSRDLDARWNLGVELLYVPLRVQREIAGSTETDALTSLRVRLAYRFD
jgi:hypothetical protein